MQNMSNLIEKRAERQAHFRQLHEGGKTWDEIGAMTGVSGERARQIGGGGQSTAQRSHVDHFLDVYRYIEGYDTTYQRSPSIREISEKFPSRFGTPTSSSVVQRWLGQMVELKMLKPRDPRIARGLVLLPLNKKNPDIARALKKENEDG